MKIKTIITDSKLKYLKWFAIIVAAIILVAVLYAVCINYYFSKSPNDRGIFGDMFGGLNALFSGLAFAGVIITLLMQMKDLELNRMELKLTREELKKSSDAQMETQKALNKQLQNMQFATKLDSIKGYIESHKEKKELDGRTVAKSILKEMTEELFFEEKYIEYVKPQLIVLDEQKKLPIIKSNELNEITSVSFFVKNIGAGFSMDLQMSQSLNRGINFTLAKISELDKNGQPALYQHSELIDRDEEFLLIISTDGLKTTSTFNFEMQGAIVEHKWIQKLKFSVFENKVMYSIERPFIFMKKGDWQQLF